jgi:alpha-D-xyloside xylohydrolase
MSTASLSIALQSDAVVLERGELRVEIDLQPFSMTVGRRGRRLLRAAGMWVAQGTIHDHFIQFTEGVVAREELAPPERARRAVVLARLNTGIDLGLVLDGGRGARLRVRLPERDVIAFELEAEGDPLRLAIDWDRRSDEHVVGLGARHCSQLDQVGRTVQLGADRTGSRCGSARARS